jgi:CDP-diacylglycerol--glycerol-3-phosphate 3-phosphatidyltransferase
MASDHGTQPDELFALEKTYVQLRRLRSSAIPNTGQVVVTLYELKPQFQRLMRPLASSLHARGVTANMVTLAAAAASVLLGLLLWGLGATWTWLFALLPVWLLLRMALNAVDGVLAREFGQRSALGACLNEIGDIVSDAAMILPFAVLTAFSPSLVVLVALGATLVELVGVLGLMVGAERRYEGPLGKSDRALVFGGLGAWIAWAGSLPTWSAYLMPLILVLLCLTIANRVRAGLRNSRNPVGNDGV